MSKKRWSLFLLSVVVCLIAGTFLLFQLKLIDIDLQTNSIFSNMIGIQQVCPPQNPHCKTPDPEPPTLVPPTLVPPTPVPPTPVPPVPTSANPGPNSSPNRHATLTEIAVLTQNASVVLSVTNTPSIDLPNVPEDGQTPSEVAQENQPTLSPTEDNPVPPASPTIMPYVIMTLVIVGVVFLAASLFKKHGG